MSIIINRVYTKVGDAGTTRLAGGQERAKDDLRIEAYGTIDELNAVLGLVAESLEDSALLLSVRRIQNELFDLGGELAVLLEDRHEAQLLIEESAVEELEAELDAANAALPALRSFILPGGGEPSSRMHLARTVCRRAERRLVSLHAVEPQRGVALRYMNRLSDWLFVMGRRAAIEAGHEEVMWQPGASRSSKP